MRYSHGDGQENKPAMGNPHEASVSGAGDTAASSPPGLTPGPTRNGSDGAPVFTISGSPLSTGPVSDRPATGASSTTPTTPDTRLSTTDGPLLLDSSVAVQSDGESSDNNARQDSNNEANDTAFPEQRELVAEDELRSSRGVWSHDIFAVFATFSSIFGFFNLTRFAILTYIYKACFLFEFLVLSAIFGIPFLYLQMTLGQYLGSGILNMWYISPAFRGVGVALVLVYFTCGVYFPVPVSWLFFYFRDSFIKARDAYKWSICQARFAYSGCYKSNSSSPEFLGWTTASYFHGRILDRRPALPANSLGEIKFELAFNLGIIWLLIFIALSRSLKSFGKILLVMGILSLSLLVFVTIRMTEQWGVGLASLFVADWRGILADADSWMMAAREVFFTWGLFGALALHTSCHNKVTTNITRIMICVASLVCTVLVLASALFASVVHLLYRHGMLLVSSSFEEESTVRFLQSFNGPWVPLANSTAVNLLTGVLLQTSKKHNHFSGYHVSRLAFEVFPAALSAESGRSVSPFWPICFYVMLATLGLSQQMCVWNCIVDAIVMVQPKALAKWRTIVTFGTCIVGFLLGLFFTTDASLQVMLFVDIWLGSLWWIVALYFIMLIVVLFIQGKPFGTDKLVKMIIQRESQLSVYLPVLTFHWNVLLPISFLMLSIVFMRSGHLTMFSPESMGLYYRYWSPWVGSFCVLLQTLPLLSVAVVAVAQGLKIVVFSKTHNQMHERIESWCCPTFAAASPENTSSATSETTQGVSNVAFEEDVPPKYSPPPSYSTATARMLLKELHVTQPSAGSSRIFFTQGLDKSDFTLHIGTAGLPRSSHLGDNSSEA